MSRYPLVSIVIVNYNGKNFIKECINPALTSDYPDFEVIVIDNGSTDGSYEYLQETYAENDKTKIVHSDKNLYFTGGCNLGAKHAQGEKLIFLNSDTIVTKNWLKELVNFVEDNQKFLVQPKILKHYPPSLKLRGAGVNTVDNAGGRYIFPGFGVGIGHGEIDRGQYDKNSQVDFVNGTCFMIDKDFFWQLGGFDETYHFFYEDVDLCLRAKKQRGQCWYCHQSIIYHYGGKTLKDNIAQERIIAYTKRNRRRTIQKNFTGLNKLLRLSTLTIAELASTTPLSKASLLIAPTHQGFVNYLRFWELKTLLKKKRFNLLDLGCGDGSFVNLSHQYGINALGVDKSPLPDSNTIASSIENLQFHQTFDVITMFHVLEHTKNPEAVLRKAISFLQENGVLVIEVPLVGNLTEKFLGKKYFAYHDDSHLNFFSKKETFALLSKVNLKAKKKGFTLLQFPLTILTTSSRQNPWQFLKAIALFLPLKLLTILGLNDEIIRLYCRKNRHREKKKPSHLQTATAAGCKRALVGV